MAATRKVPTTLKEVAKEAGVSIQTVSRVVNERPDVAPETRQRVLSIIDRLGYRPNVLARSLIRRRSHTLGVVTAGLMYTGPSRTLNGIAAQAQRMNYSLLVKELPDFGGFRVQPLLDDLLARQVDGVIWAVAEVGENRAEFVDHLVEAPVPIVFLTMAPRAGWHIVAIDNEAGGRLATEHLLAQGRRRIGHITGPLDWWEARERRAGWEAALAAAGMPAPAPWCVEGDWSSISGSEGIAQLLAQVPDLEAVFVGNDQMALGVLHYAHRRGIRVPGDLAVVGFDDITEAAYFSPPLTTIHHDQHRLGCTAVQEIVRRIEAEQEDNTTGGDPRYAHIQPTLIVRESSV
ncbi:MAG: LacI family transcriptional regulator [Caldilineales bacterium]|nr:LacI family transcriptional regulator [Caldilineales bacterium]MCW5860723.1 LacI family DNA-binding transcriptional regulator [Caldilineales bacterium]